MSSIWKTMLRLIGRACFALISFLVLLYLAGVFFASLGQGIGSSLFRAERQAARDSYTYVSGTKESKNRLLYLPVEGIILGSAPGYLSSNLSLPGVTFGYGVKDLLKKVAKDDSVKGILLWLQTPGGTIFGSQAIFDGVKAYQQATGKPVVAYVEGLAASGGVMAMVGANAIYADQGSAVGSIGVLGPAWFYYDKPKATEGGLFGGGVVTEGGIERTIISAGRGKDLGNPFRRPTPEELGNLQKGVDIEYGRFVKHVADNRKMSESLIREQMGAQVFDNQTAQEYGLIDGTLNRDDTIAKLAELAKVGEDYQLVRSKVDRGVFFERLFGALGLQSLEQTHLRQQVQQEFCETVERLPVAYHGDIARLCW
jgi:protease-4